MNPKRQSFWLIFLQVASVILGFFTVFYVAGKLPPSVFAVMGIYSIILNAITVFSNTGLETFAGRNVLDWNNNGKEDLTKQIVSQAFFVRAIIALLLVVPMIGYSYYVSHSKFNGQYFPLFVLMCFSSAIQAMNDSQCLSLKAFNNYLLSALSSSSIQVFGKFIALILFVKYGFFAYVYTILAIPVVITIPLYFIMRKWIDIKYLVDFKSIINNIKENKYFTLSAYLNFGIRQLDLLLVSLFVKIDVLGTYSLVKRIESVIINVISNLFDPSLQTLVKYKHDTEKWIQTTLNVVSFQKKILCVYLVGIVVAVLLLPNLISIAHLQSYPFLFDYLICLLIAQFVYALYRVRYFIIQTFYSPQSTFYSILLNGVFLLVSFLLMQLFNPKYLYCFSILGNLAMAFYVFKLLPDYKKCNFLKDNY